MDVTARIAAVGTLGLVLVLPPAPGLVRAGGTIAGTVSTRETAPRPVQVSVDTNVCGGSVADESIAVSATGALANVVIRVPGVKNVAPAEAAIANQKCQFVPRVAVVRPSGSVAVSNRDPVVLHTAHATTADGRTVFNVSLLPGLTLTKTVGAAGLVRIACDTHTWMRGYLYVTDELAAVTGADGSFRLAGVPPGTYDLSIWHETLKAAAPVHVTVKDGETSTVSVLMVK
jgi:hypothetical protein